jgi:cyclomaltodextrinase
MTSNKTIGHIPEWVSRTVFYQIFPDRFARSGRKTQAGEFEDWLSEPNLYGFKGGDLWGILEKLDYLQELGVNGIYLNPVFTSTANHRYHTHDYFNVDPILGGNAALRALIDEMHRRSMRIVLDGVFNHASRGFFQFNHALENGKHSPYLSWFFFNRGMLDGGQQIKAYCDSHRLPGESSLPIFERCGYEAWWNLPALPKFNTNNPEVREFIFSVAEFWIDFGIDGWRLDVPEEIDDVEFWRTFRTRVKARNPEAYIVGEIWHEAPRWLEGDQFDALMNYPFGKAAIGYFFAQSLNYEQFKLCGYKDIHPLNTQEFATKIVNLSRIYSPEVTMSQMNFIGSHDTPRILNCGRGDVPGLKLLFLCLFIFPGSACLYYGDEIGIAGNHDPDCRRSFDWDDKTWNHELLDFIRSLVSARLKLTALQIGKLSVVECTEELLVLLRADDNSKCFAVFNTSLVEKEFSFSKDLKLAEKIFDILSGSELMAVNGSFSVSLPPRSGGLYSTHKIV